MMTESGELVKQKHQHELRKRRCRVVALAVLFSVVTMIVVILILAFTVFKAKDPNIQVLSSTIEGVSPRVTFPVIRIELNISIDLQINVYNRNHASFKHGTGKSQVLYKEKQVGEVDVSPGLIPSKGSENISCHLNLEADKFGSDMSSLINDVLGGEMELETKTKLPGRVKFLGIIKRHVVAVSDCHIVVGFPDLKVRRQTCKNKVKL